MKKINSTPFVVLFFLSVVNAHSSPTYLKTLIMSIFMLLPTIPIEYVTGYVMKKYHLFNTFREKPLLWCGIGMFYFFGCLLLQNSWILSSYLFASAFPFLQNFSETLRECKLRWKLITAIVALICAIFSYPLRILAILFGCGAGVALELIWSELSG